MINIKQKPKLLLPVFCTIIFLLGFHIGGLQLALLRAIYELGFEGGMIGLPITIQFISLSLTPLLFCPIADRVGKKRVLSIFMVVFIIGSFVTFMQGSAIQFLIGLFIIGAGFSVCECLVTASISDVFGEKDEKYINFSQSFFCLGALVSPLILQMLMDVFGASWRTTFLICAIAMTLVLPVLLISHTNIVATTQISTSPNKLDKKKTTNRFLLIGFILCMFIYVGIESGISYFADAIFTLQLNAQALGAYAISAFWAAMGIGRFIFGKIKKIPRRATPISLFAVTLAMVGIAFFRQEFVVLGLFAFAGFASSCVWSGIISPAVALNPEASGSIMSYLNLGAGVGGALIPFVMGYVMDSFGMSSSFLIFAIFPVIAGVFMWRNSERAAAEH